MTRLQAEILNLILRMANEFPQRKEQLIFIINNYDLILSVLTVRKFSNFIGINYFKDFDPIRDKSLFVDDLSDFLHVFPQ